MPVRRQSTVRAKRSWNFRVENDGQTLVNEDGQRLYRHVWPAPGSGKPKGIVFFLHGGMEHCRRYDSTAAKLNEAGFTMVAHDYVGHGRSEGERNYVRNFNVYARDVSAEVRELRRTHPRTPIFLAGISLGGLIGCMVATELRVEGLVLIAPAVKPDPRTATPTMVRAARVLNKVLPRLGVTGLHLDWISRNKDEVNDYKEDKLVYHGKMRACFAVAVLDACEELAKRVDRITAPLLVLHGEDDKITSLEASRFLVDSAGSADKKLMTFPEHRHNLLHELPEDAARIHATIVDWLAQHVEPASARTGAGATTAPSKAPKGQEDPEGPHSPPPSMEASQATATQAKAPTRTEIEQSLEPLAEHREGDVQVAEASEPEPRQKDQEDQDQDQDQGQAAETAVEQGAPEPALSLKPEDPRSPPPSMEASQAVKAKEEKQEQEQKQSAGDEASTAHDDKDEAEGQNGAEQALEAANRADNADAEPFKPEDPRSPPPSMATSTAVKRTEPNVQATKDGQQDNKPNKGGQAARDEPSSSRVITV